MSALALRRCTGVTHHDATHFQHIAMLRPAPAPSGRSAPPAVRAVPSSRLTRATIWKHFIGKQCGDSPRLGSSSSSRRGPRHQGACNGEHLLLAAGHRAGQLATALAQHGEIRVHALQVFCHALAPRRLADRVKAPMASGCHAPTAVRRHFAALGRMGDAGCVRSVSGAKRSHPGRSK